jgi:hypothetical protein
VLAFAAFAILAALCLTTSPANPAASLSQHHGTATAFDGHPEDRWSHRWKCPVEAVTAELDDLASFRPQGNDHLAR